METIINLYYNQHLNINLSEQDVISCSGGQSHESQCCGGDLPTAASYIKNVGVTNESCSPYSGLCWETMPNCSSRCANPQYLFKAFKPPFFDSNVLLENMVKGWIITKGPLAWGINQWLHVMSLEGFGKVREGDIIMDGDVYGAPEVLVVPGSPDIGKTYWICKNSWGSWGSDHTPYMKVIWPHPKLEVAGTRVPLTCSGSQALTEQDRRCVDLDGDGYYWWGIGAKPSTCPTCPDAEDCDDSNPFLGPYKTSDGEKYRCISLCPPHIIPLHI